MKNGLSVVIPYYHGKQFIGYCISSLIESQEFHKSKLEYEIIIIIDSDETIKKVQETIPTQNNIRVFKNETNIGVAKTRNKGLSLTKYKWVTFIDQDDFVDRKYFSVLHDLLRSSNEQIILINGYYFSEKKTPIYFVKPELKMKKLISRNRVQTPGLLIFNKELLRDQIEFNDYSEYRGTDDWACLMKIFQHSICYRYVKARIFYYRIHENNYSRNISEALLSSIYTLNNLKESAPEYRSTINLKLRTLKYELQICHDGMKSYANPLLLILTYYFKLDINKLLSRIYKLWR